MTHFGKKKICGSEARKASRYRDAAFLRQGGQCYWCGVGMVKSRGVATNDRDPRLSTADHVVPRSAGGKTVPENIVAACKNCNCSIRAAANSFGAEATA